jgi:hypothetical protein
MVAVMQPGNRITVFGAAGTGKSWLVRQYIATSYVVIGITALSVKHYPNSSTYEMYMLDRETVHDIVIVEEIGLLSAVQYDVLSQRVGDNSSGYRLLDIQHTPQGISTTRHSTHPRSGYRLLDIQHTPVRGTHFIR